MNVDPRLNDIDDCLYRLSVKALVRNDKGQYLICKEVEGWWNFPGGGLDHGESPELGLRREIIEELGIGESDVLKIHPEVKFIAFGKGATDVPKANIFYVADIDTSNIKPTEEILEVQWITPDQIPALTWSPGLGNPQTLTANLQKLI